MWLENPSKFAIHTQWPRRIASTAKEARLLNRTTAAPVLFRSRHPGYRDDCVPSRSSSHRRSHGPIQTRRDHRRTRQCPSRTAGDGGHKSSTSRWIALAEFKTLCGEMDASNPKATTPQGTSEVRRPSVPISTPRAAPCSRTPRASSSSMGWARRSLRSSRRHHHLDVRAPACSSTGAGTTYCRGVTPVINNDGELYDVLDVLRRTWAFAAASPTVPGR